MGSWGMGLRKLYYEWVGRVVDWIGERKKGRGGEMSSKGFVRWNVHVRIALR